MQHFAPAPWVAAGVALIGAGAVAATPVAVPLPGLTATHSAVALTADFDPFGAWQDVFATAKDNATTLWDSMSAVPGVAAQQLIADLIHGTSIDPQAIIDAIAQPNMATDLPMSPVGLSNDGLQTLITGLSYTFGGLLSPGLTSTDVDGFIKEISDGSSPGIGGSIINGLGPHHRSHGLPDGG